MVTVEKSRSGEHPSKNIRRRILSKRSRAGLNILHTIVLIATKYTSIYVHNITDVNLAPNFIKNKN